MLYDYMMRLSQLLEDGFKTQFTLGGWTFSWYQIYVFDIVASLLIMIIIGIVKED